MPVYLSVMWCWYVQQTQAGGTTSYMKAGKQPALLIIAVCLNFSPQAVAQITRSASLRWRKSSFWRYLSVWLSWNILKPKQLKVQKPGSQLHEESEKNGQNGLQKSLSIYKSFKSFNTMSPFERWIGDSLYCRQQKLKSGEDINIMVAASVLSQSILPISY